MTEVRRHQRQTASGKTATVRQHERNTGGGRAWADRVQETTQRGWAVPARAEHAEPPRDDELWDDDEATPAGDWWAEDQETAECPDCGKTLPVNLGGTLSGHRDPDDPDDPSRYCPGSGTQMHE